MLRLIPALEVLWMGLATPRALRRAFFLGFVARGLSSNAATGPSNRITEPYCKGLKSLHLHYRRWLRDLEKTNVIRTFGDIVASHGPENRPDFSLSLSFDEGTKGQVWTVNNPVEKPELCDWGVTIGFSHPHGILPFSPTQRHHDVISPLFRESEHLHIVNWNRNRFPIDFLFLFHNLGEFRLTKSSLVIQSNTQLSSNLPIFHTLKVLHVYHIENQILAGHTFHKLEKYTEYWSLSGVIPDQLTEMPVCTRLSLALCRLATFKLRQICELRIEIDHFELNMVWEKHVAVNSNLSGLKLLVVHSWRWEPEWDFIQILRSLPALETFAYLFAWGRSLNVAFFRAFAPIDAQGKFRSTGQGQTPGVLCPKLKTLWFDSVHFTGLKPVLKDIVNLRAAVGFPLKHFICWGELVEGEPYKQWGLIGKDGSFTMEMVVPRKPFDFNI